MTKAYISGAISSDPDYMYRFANAERLLKNYFDAVYNPTCHFVEGWDWWDYIRHDGDILWHGNFTHIVRIDTWFHSRGSLVEQIICHEKDIAIIDLSDVQERMEMKK